MTNDRISEIRANLSEIDLMLYKHTKEFKQGAQPTRLYDCMNELEHIKTELRKEILEH